MQHTKRDLACRLCGDIMLQAKSYVGTAVVVSLALASFSWVGAGENATKQPLRAANPHMHTNRLIDSNNPYLLLHAHNPVDWYPWGDEALARAKRENKPIFLSIGYATCHWCHVMEKESFEDDGTARYLNEHFIAIKVDREQRPDLDALFIDAVARLGGNTGWPLTVVLTPDLEPVFGGTYFPRARDRGMPGLLEVLAEVLGKWREQGPDLARRGRDLLAEIQRQARE